MRSCPIRSDTGQREKPPNPSGKSKGRCLAAFPARSKPAAGILPRRCLTIQTPLALARHSPVFRQSLKGSARASLNEPLQGRGRKGNMAVESVSREDKGPAPVSPTGVSNRTESQWRRVRVKMSGYSQVIHRLHNRKNAPFSTWIASGWRKGEKAKVKGGRTAQQASAFSLKVFSLKASPLPLFLSP